MQAETTMTKARQATITFDPDLGSVERDAVVDEIAKCLSFVEGIYIVEIADDETDAEIEI